MILIKLKKEHAHDYIALARWQTSIQFVSGLRTGASTQVFYLSCIVKNSHFCRPFLSSIHNRSLNIKFTSALVSSPQVFYVLVTHIFLNLLFSRTYECMCAIWKINTVVLLQHPSTKLHICTWELKYNGKIPSITHFLDWSCTWEI